ncbi:unnamed protein product, partial [Rotaria sp. Silwood1]
FKSSDTSSLQTDLSINIKLQQKISQDFNVENKIHGCINSSVSEDIDIYLSSLYDISIIADTILHDRYSQISSKEQTIINKIIEEFIVKLEIEMSKHLDNLQKEMETEKEIVFISSHDNIKDLSIKTSNAKTEFIRLLECSTKTKRQEILDKISNISMDKKHQPLGYEQLRKVNLENYSTVGIKQDGQGCDNILDRNKYIKDIDNTKSRQPIKRTIYIG